MTDDRRLKIAKELCARDGLKDGRKWETLHEVIVNAYLHNADVIIEQEAEARQEVVDAQEALNAASIIPQEVPVVVEKPSDIAPEPSGDESGESYINEVDNVPKPESDRGTESNDKAAGSADTGKPGKPKAPKRKRAAAKKSR